MQRAVLSVLFVLIPLGIAWAQGQPVDDKACQETITTNCTRCHATGRICHELDEANAKWPEIIKEMGEKGSLSQEVQDTVLACLTTASDPKKFVCTE